MSNKNYYNFKSVEIFKLLSTSLSTTQKLTLNERTHFSRLMITSRDRRIFKIIKLYFQSEKKCIINIALLDFMEINRFPCALIFLEYL